MARRLAPKVQRTSCTTEEELIWTPISRTIMGQTIRKTDHTTRFRENPWMGMPICSQRPEAISRRLCRRLAYGRRRDEYGQNVEKDSNQDGIRTTSSISRQQIPWMYAIRCRNRQQTSPREVRPLRVHQQCANQDDGCQINEAA